MKEKIVVALAGQPNVGKSSIINKISGSNLKVGNFAGVTIEKAEAKLSYKGYEITIIDLPGTYSLNQYSPEEKVTQDFLLEKNYDIILNVADSTNLERNLILTAQLLELDKKLLLALNMNDEAQKENIEIDSHRLAETLGIDILKVSAKNQDDMQALLDEIVNLHKSPIRPSKRTYHPNIQKAIQELESFLSAHKSPSIEQAMQTKRIATLRHLAILLLQQNEETQALLRADPSWEKLSSLLNQLRSDIYKSFEESSMQIIFTLDHHAFAKQASQEAQKQKTAPQNKTQNIDSFLINKYLGIPVFLVLMWILFQITFTLGETPKVMIEDAFASLGDLIKESIANESIASLLSDGIIAGVGAVLSFLPHILILFFGIVLLESTGYMARVAFLLDGFFHRFGLHGKSFIPLVTGFGCSVPAYMSTRTLKNRSDKMLTLFVINFMSCSARLPVYVLFIGAFFPANQSGNILFGLYIFGAIVGLAMAKILKLTAFKGVDEAFVMEMPKYRMPSLKLVVLSVWNKAKMYIKKAGTFILIASIGIWFAGKYPQNEEIIAQYEQKQKILEENNASQEQIDAILNEQNALLLEQTYLGKFGEFLSPIFSPFNFDWRLSVSLVTGIAAKEVMISTLGVLYALGEDLDETSHKLMETIKDKISVPTAIAFLIFVMFYNPCFAATIVFGKEAGGKKYIYYLFAFTSIVAYIFALLGYFSARLFF